MTKQKKIIIGTRGSRLALWQANFTKAQLEKLGCEAGLQIIKTKGDQVQDLSFDKLEGKGFFTKEIEDALLREEIDMAVHSMKDLPTSSPGGLKITAVSYRENPADWLLVRKDAVDQSQIFNIKANAVVGTSSARRKAQLHDFRKDFQIKDIRGNVPTRIRKLEEGSFDGIVLAAAGITRLALDLSAFTIVKLNPKEFVPAPAQGVLAYQVRAHDTPIRSILKQIHHPEVAELTNIERKVLQLLQGGCQMPLGVYCEKDAQGNYHIWAARAGRWQDTLQRVRLSSSTRHQLAEQVVEALQLAGKDAQN